MIDSTWFNLPRERLFSFYQQDVRWFQWQNWAILFLAEALNDNSRISFIDGIINNSQILHFRSDSWNEF